MLLICPSPFYIHAQDAPYGAASKRSRKKELKISPAQNEGLGMSEHGRCDEVKMGSEEWDGGVNTLGCVISSLCCCHPSVPLCV